MGIRFLKVKCIDGFHIIKINSIQNIYPASGEQNRSAICIFNQNDNVILYSTESQEEIYMKIVKNSVK
jgi:hypothetical protein